MIPTCAWAFNHPGETPLAINICTLPGALDGGPEWFGGSEPPIIRNLCGDCSATFVSQNGGPKKVLVEAIGIPVPEGSLFSPPRRETQLF